MHKTLNTFQFPTEQLRVLAFHKPDPPPPHPQPLKSLAIVFIGNSGSLQLKPFLAAIALDSG